jgi:hypothetical protein
MEKERAKEIFDRIKKGKIKAIDDFIITRKVEELFIDFKRSADDGVAETLHQNDRNNFAKSISGFGNSEGGIVVWGVDCSKDVDGADVAKAKHPIKNVDRFISLLQSAISGCTTPSHAQVENHPIKEKNKQSGFVITLIPKSNRAPHQAISNNQYYMRAGSSFVPVPHAVLSGMFGRRPQPKVYLMYSVVPAKISKTASEGAEVLCKVGFLIGNDGLGIARDVFMNAEIYNGPGKKSKAWFELTDTENWITSFAFGYKLGIICKEGFRIPPRNFHQPVILNLSLVPPFENGLKIKLECGCEGSEVFSTELDSSKDNIMENYKAIIAATDSESSINLVKNVFVIKDKVRNNNKR